MRIQEVKDLEAQNIEYIYVIKGSIYYQAYFTSAFHLSYVMPELHAYKRNYSSYKVVAPTVVIDRHYFLSRLQAGAIPADLIDETESYIKLRPHSVRPDEYDTWESGLQEKKNRFTKRNTAEDLKFRKVARGIIQFDVDNATPMEALRLLSNLKKELVGIQKHRRPGRPRKQRS